LMTSSPHALLPEDLENPTFSTRNSVASHSIEEESLEEPTFLKVDPGSIHYFEDLDHGDSTVLNIKPKADQGKSELTISVSNVHQTSTRVAHGNRTSADSRQAQNNNNSGTTPTGGSCSSKHTTKTWVLRAVAATCLLGIGAIAGYCGSGDCRSSSTSSSPSMKNNTLSPVSPTAAPFPPPTMNPRPSTATPVVQPVSLPTDVPRAQSILDFINRITLSNRTLRYPPPDKNMSTAEEKAVQWLIDENDDSIGTSPSSYNISLGQRYALATVWFQGPTRGFDARHAETWATNISECVWLDVECDDFGTVTSLMLSNDVVRGRIPDDLALLTALSILGLNSHDDLTGTIPSSLGVLTALTSLNLSNNQLTGTIPSSFGALTALAGLFLNSNHLTGTIPSSMGLLTALATLNLSDNQLTGTIPPSFGALTALAGLFLSSNALTGTIPSSLGV
jgi:Leucine-rich repeat (LRR) protein